MSRPPRLSGFVFCILAGIACRASAAELDWVRVGPSGKSIIFLFKDGGGEAKAVVKSLARHPRITVNGSETIALGEPIYRKTALQYGQQCGLPYIIYPLFHKVLTATDRIAVSAPAEWVTCLGGPIGALRNAPVDNYVGKSLLPPLGKRHTMAVGFNLCPDGWGEAQFMRANLMRAENFGYKSTHPENKPVPLGPNGLPTSVENGPVLTIPCKINVAGDYTLLWDGTGKLEFGHDDQHLRPKLDHYAGGVDNKRVYAVGKSPWPQWRAQVWFLGSDVRNVRLYPPGVKTDGSQYFHPDFLRWLRGARTIRFIQELNCCNTDLSTFDELRQDREEVQIPDKTITATVVAAEPYDNKARYFIAQDRSFIKFRTAQPHHFKSGHTVHVACDMKVALASGTSLDLKGFASSIYVLSPTEFAACAYTPGQPTTLRAPRAIKGTAAVTVLRGDTWLSEMADLVNAVPGCDMWLNIPNMMEDDAVRKMFELVGRRLAKGRKVRVEYSNEVWHWMWSGTPYCWGMANTDPDPLIARSKWFRVWYAKRAAEVQAIGREVFRRLGRERDLVGVLACQMGAVPEAELRYAKDARVSFDAVAVAPYYNVGPGFGWDYWEHDLDGVLKKVDVDQICDMADMNVQHNNIIERDMSRMIQGLKKLNFTGKLVCYEGGPESAYFPKMSLKEQQASSQGWSHHPRMAPWLGYFLQSLQDKHGVQVYNAYTLSCGVGNEGRNIWPVYTTRWNQLDGKGDGSDGLFSNLSDLQSKDCVSVLGYAYHDWIDHTTQKKAAGKERP